MKMVPSALRTVFLSAVGPGVLGCAAVLTVVAMAVPLRPNAGDEMKTAEFSEDLGSLTGEQELQLEAHGFNPVRPEAALGSRDNKVLIRGGVRRSDDADSVWQKRLHPEEREPSSNLPLAEQLRRSMLLIREQKRELSELTETLRERREVSLLLKERLEVLWGRAHPDTIEGRRLQQGLAQGLRLAEQLVHIFSAEIPEEGEIGEQVPWPGPSVSIDGVCHEDKEENILQASEGKEPETSSRGSSKAGDIQQPPCATAAMLDEAEVPSLGTPELQNHCEDEAVLQPEALSQHLALDGKPIEQFQKWTSILLYLRLSLKDLLTQGGPARHQGQSHQEQRAEWLGLAKNVTLELGPEQHCEGAGEEETQSLDSSVELRGEEVAELPSQSVEELPFPGSGLPAAPGPQEHLSAAGPGEEPEASPAPGGNEAEDMLTAEDEEASELRRNFHSALKKNMLMWTSLRQTASTWRARIKHLRGKIRNLLSQEHRASPQGQSHQGHAEGCKMPEHWAWQLGPEPDLASSFEGKNAPAGESDATHGTQAPSLPRAAAAQKQRRSKAQLHLGKMACRFPQASGVEVPAAAPKGDPARVGGLATRQPAALV